MGFSPKVRNSCGLYAITVQPHRAGTPYTSPLLSCLPWAFLRIRSFQHCGIFAQYLQPQARIMLHQLLLRPQPLGNPYQTRRAVLAEYL